MNKNVIINQEIGDLFKIGCILQDVFKKITIFRPYLNEEKKDFIPNFKFNSKQINYLFSAVEELEKNNLLLERVEKNFWDNKDNCFPSANWNFDDCISSYIEEIRIAASEFAVYKNTVEYEEEWGQSTDKLFACEINNDAETAEEFKSNIRMLIVILDYLVQLVSDVLFKNPTVLQVNFQ